MFVRVFTSLLATLAIAGGALAQSFAGTYTGKTEDGDCTLELKQSGDKVTGTYTVGTTKLLVNTVVLSGQAQGAVTFEGATLFYVVFSIEGGKLLASVSELDDNGKPDFKTTQKIVFAKAGSTGGDTGGTKAEVTGYLDADALKTVAGKVKTNFKRDKGSTVLAEGEPPLTLESVAAFAEILKMCFGAEMTEAEFDVTSKHFVKYYESGDAGTKTMLAGGWQKILAGLNSLSGAEKDKQVKDVHDVLQSRFEAGAKAGMPWAVAMKNAIDMRTQNVANVGGDVPDYAKNGNLHKEMTAADLESSLEMLYFMWVASGRDANLVTPESTAMVRNAIVQNFATFPQDVQYIFANAQKVYSYLRGQWAQATPQQRAAMAQQFGQSLDALGLTVPGADGDTRFKTSGAWADMNGKSHGEWAGEMVQGLAGASYHNAWSGG